MHQITTVQVTRDCAEHNTYADYIMTQLLCQKDSRPGPPISIFFLFFVHASHMYPHREQK